jgi:hypothetical protein
MRPLSSMSKHLPLCTKLYIDTGFWILIHIDLAVLDPDPYWECGSGSKSMEIESQKLTNKSGFLPFKYAFLP